MAAPQSYLGIDIGGSGIKLVELAADNGRARLLTYGYAEYSFDGDGASRDMSAEATARVLDDLFQQTGAKSKTAITALPTYAVFSSIISLPAMDDKDLSDAVQYEAKKVVPLPLDEMMLDFKVLNGASSAKSDASSEEVGVIKEKGTQTKKILITAAPKKLVQRYVDVFNNSALTLESLETEAFAITRSLVGHDQSTIMILDIGATNTNISIIDNGIPVLNRGIDAGGLNITRTLAKSMGIETERAEQFKKDLAFLMHDNRVEALPSSIEGALTPIVNEVKYIFNLYRSQIVEFGLENGGVEKIVLTGGAAFVPFLAEYLSNLLNVRVYLGDPWARVIYPEDAKPLLDELGPRFAIAIGLAMRNID